MSDASRVVSYSRGPPTIFHRGMRRTISDFRRHASGERTLAQASDASPCVALSTGYG
jgi:hypothetical protein